MTSRAIGFRVGASLGLGYVKNRDGLSKEWLTSGALEVDIAMKPYRISAQFGHWYDPGGERIQN